MWIAILIKSIRRYISNFYHCALSNTQSQLLSIRSPHQPDRVQFALRYNNNQHDKNRRYMPTNFMASVYVLHNIMLEIGDNSIGRT